MAVIIDFGIPPTYSIPMTSFQMVYISISHMANATSNINPFTFPMFSAFMYMYYHLSSIFLGCSYIAFVVNERDKFGVCATPLIPPILSAA